MQTRKLLPGIAGGTAGFLIALGAWQAFGQGDVESEDIVALTYTQSTWDSRSLNADEIDGVEKLQVGAVRVDGSTALTTYRISSDGTTSDLRVIVDLANARVSMVDSAVKSVTTSVMSPDAAANKRSRRPSCRDGEAAGSFLGYEVIRVVAPTTSGPEGSQVRRIRSDTLVAPQLGCLPLEHKLIMTYDDGSERDIRVTRVLDVKLGEPDNSYFSVPADYVEMSPISRIQATGLDPSDISNDYLLQDAEQKYQQARRVE